MERINLTLSFSQTIRRYVVIPTLNRLVECDTSLQLIGFPTLLGIHQLTQTRRKPYEYWNM